MLISLLVIAIALFWLLIETDFMRIRLPYGKKLNNGVLMLSPAKTETILMLPKASQSSYFMPCEIAENTDYVYKTIVNVSAKISGKLQALNENLIKALTGIKEKYVSICNVIVDRKILLEALKINKDYGLVEIETGKTTWLNDKDDIDRDVRDWTCLKICLNRTKLTFFNQKPDYKNPYPAKIDFSHSQTKQGIVINSGELLEALNYIMPCLLTDDSRLALQCILFDSNHDTGILNLVTADGFRLAKTQIQVAGIPTDRVLIEDVKTLSSFLKAIKPDKFRVNKQTIIEYPNINLLYEDKTLKFSHNTSSIVLEKQDHTFPDYEPLIPNNDGYKIEFWSKDMLQAVNSLKSVASQGSNAVRMQFFKSDELGDKCLLSAKSEDTGVNIVEIQCKVSQDCKFALNYKYMIDYLNTVKSSYVTMYISSPSSPAKFEVNNKIEVIMPMFVAWEDETKTEPKPIEVVTETANDLIEVN